MAAAEEEAEEVEEEVEEEEVEDHKGLAMETSPCNPHTTRRSQISSPASGSCRNTCSATSIRSAGKRYTAISRPQRSKRAGAIAKYPGLI